MYWMLHNIICYVHMFMHILLHVWSYLTDDRTVCEECNTTTTAELSDEEEESVKRRKKKKYLKTSALQVRIKSKGNMLSIDCTVNIRYVINSQC